MSEMKSCRLCGVKQSGADKSNNQFDAIVKMVLDSGDEKQLVSLIRIMSERVTLCVSTSIGPNLLAYEGDSLAKARVISQASERLKRKLEIRTNGTSLDTALWVMGTIQNPEKWKDGYEGAGDMNIIFNYLKTQQLYRELDGGRTYE